MHHEPSRLIADLQHAVDLMGANPLLGGGHQEQRGQPLAERQLGALENGLNGNRELLATIVALVHASAVRVATERRSVNRAAMRADRTFRPDAGFKPLAGGGVVLEDRVLENGREHGSGSFLTPY
jgi:hypothetical protein